MQGASRHVQLMRDRQHAAEERIRDAEERDVLSVERDHGDSLEIPLRFATHADFAAWRRTLPHR